jgi:nitrogen regulatory protein PII
MIFYRVEGRGKIKAKPVAIDRGTRHFTPEFVPRMKMEVVVSDNQVDDIIRWWMYLRLLILQQRSKEKRLFN